MISHEAGRRREKKEGKAVVLCEDAFRIRHFQRKRKGVNGVLITEFKREEHGLLEHAYVVNRFQRMAIRFLFRFVLRNTELEPDTCLYIATDRKSIEDIVHAGDSLRKKREEKKEP